MPNLKWCSGDSSTFWHFVPYNLCLLAAIIRKQCDVEILDAYAEGLSVEQLGERIKASGPDLVGITVMMDQFAEAGHIAVKKSKEVMPECRVVMGGVYVTVAQENVMANSNLDFAVMGEGEYVLDGLVKYLQGEVESLPSAGLCYRHEGKIVNTGRAPFIYDLDELPMPAYDLIDFLSYGNNFARKSVGSPKAYPYARLFTSRGCPQKCCFCQVMHISGRKYRARSTQSILDEIRWLKEEYCVQSLIFDDDNLFTNRKHCIELFEGMIANGLNMPWASISTAVFRLDEEVLALAKESGCTFLNIAIESGSVRVIKDVVDKPIDYQHAVEMVKAARKAGIYVAANFIIGFPTETWDEIQETISFAERLNADYVKIFHAIPLRNTRMWELCEEHGAFKDGFRVDDIRWSIGQISSEYFTANDLTILRAYEWDRINFADPVKRRRTSIEMGVSEDELLQIRRETLLNAQRSIATESCKG